MERSKSWKGPYIESNISRLSSASYFYSRKLKHEVKKLQNLKKENAESKFGRSSRSGSTLRTSFAGGRPGSNTAMNVLKGKINSLEDKRRSLIEQINEVRIDKNKYKLIYEECQKQIKELSGKLAAEEAKLTEKKTKIEKDSSEARIHEIKSRKASKETVQQIRSLEQFIKLKQREAELKPLSEADDSQPIAVERQQPKKKADSTLVEQAANRLKLLKAELDKYNELLSRTGSKSAEQLVAKIKEKEESHRNSYNTIRMLDQQIYDLQQQLVSEEKQLLKQTTASLATHSKGKAARIATLTKELEELRQQNCRLEEAEKAETPEFQRILEFSKLICERLKPELRESIELDSRVPLKGQNLLQFLIRLDDKTQNFKIEFASSEKKKDSSVKQTHQQEFRNYLQRMGDQYESIKRASESTEDKSQKLLKEPRDTKFYTQAQLRSIAMQKLIKQIRVERGPNKKK